MPIKRNPIFGVMPPIKSTAEQWASKLMATHSQPKPQPPSVEDDSKPLYYIRGDAASEHARYMQRYQSNSRKTFDHNKLQEILAKNGIPNPNMSRPPAKSATKRPMQDDSSEEEVYIPRSKRQQQVNLIPDPHPEQQSMQEVEMAYRPQTPPPSQTSSRPCKTYDINKSDSIFRTGMVVDNGLNSVLVWKCKEKNCNFQARFRANLEFHHLDHKISKPLHQCRNCSMSFEKKRCYKEHMDSYCVKLAKTFAVNSCLSLREEVHALAKTYNFLKCPQFERCAFVCNNHEQLRLHKAESHCRPDQINFDCRLCGLGFADQQAYYEHEALFCWSGLEMEEEDGKLFSCKHESCEFQSFSKAEEITHIATHCPGGIFTNFKCRFCGFCFTSEKVVGEHEMYFCGNNV
uniref:C2H2-type domain-containing protein n=1 Tax=Rhabditophanes sp. KR3021 TaxID=114890 RepID=A0AC35U9A8_9BILA